MIFRCAHFPDLTRNASEMSKKEQEISLKTVSDQNNIFSFDNHQRSVLRFSKTILCDLSQLLGEESRVQNTINAKRYQCKSL